MYCMLAQKEKKIGESKFESLLSKDSVYVVGPSANQLNANIAAYLFVNSPNNMLIITFCVILTGCRRHSY